MAETEMVSALSSATQTGLNSISDGRKTGKRQENEKMINKLLDINLTNVHETDAAAIAIIVLYTLTSCAGQRKCGVFIYLCDQVFLQKDRDIVQ